MARFSEIGYTDGDPLVPTRQLIQVLHHPYLSIEPPKWVLG